MKLSVIMLLLHTQGRLPDEYEIQYEDVNIDPDQAEIPPK